jgi:hypothetical protein
VVDILVYRAVRCSGNALDLRSESHIIARSRSGQEALSTCVGVSTTLAITFKARRDHGHLHINAKEMYLGADKSLARPASRCILFDGGNISFAASLVIYIYIYIVLIFLQL